jgi:hypothetical protein
MRMRTAVLAIAAISVTTPAHAYEFGYPGWAQKPGIVIGAAAEAPPPGLYGFDQLLTYQAHLVGPGTPLNANGAPTRVTGDTLAQGFVWVPGLKVLGATYDAVAVFQVISATVGPPINFDATGLHNAFTAQELSWKLGESGVFVKAGFGAYLPTGNLQGPTGLQNIGNPWWTFQPNLVVSYLKDGWNLTANVFDEINTENVRTKYLSGDILHAEFTATKTIGKWTLGPVAYYSGQITDDRSSPFYRGAINVNRYNLWAAGGLVGYDFGRVSLSVWAMQEFSANASGGTAGPPGIDTATISKGFSVIGQINYRIWAPDQPSSRTAPQPPSHLMPNY